MANKTLTDQLKEVISDALDSHSQGDPIDWDVVAGMGPDNQLFHFVTLILPRPILGEAIMGGIMLLANQKRSNEEVVMAIQQTLEGLRSARSQKLSEELPAQTNTGIILP